MPIVVVRLSAIQSGAFALRKSSSMRNSSAMPSDVTIEGTIRLAMAT